MNTVIQAGPRPLVAEDLSPFEMYGVLPSVVKGAKLTLWVHYYIIGQPFSKANSRQFVMVNSRGGGKRPAFIKSAEARNYVAVATTQTPMLVPPLRCDVAVFMKMWYRSRRSDMDKALVLDCMQKRVISNDRQVVARFTTRGIDAINPRVNVMVAEIS